MHVNPDRCEGQYLASEVFRMVPVIDPTDPRSPSRQIADDLRIAIDSGELAPGSKIPSERELVERYGTAAQTARQAVSLLKAEGDRKSVV